MLCCAHLGVAVLEAQLGECAWWQSHVLEGLGPEAALEGDVVDAEGHLAVLELTAGLVHILIHTHSMGAHTQGNTQGREKAVVAVVAVVVWGVCGGRGKRCSRVVVSRSVV